jgi:hypothetical protein
LGKNEYDETRQNPSISWMDDEDIQLLLLNSNMDSPQQVLDANGIPK